MSLPNLHPAFKISGQSYNVNSLTAYAQELAADAEVFRADIGRFILDWLSPETFVKVQTSGSTGTPKTIAIQKQHMYQSALATGVFFEVQEGTRALLCLSAGYIAGKMMLVRAMVLGWDLHWVAPSTAPLEGVQQSFDFSAMVPMQVQNSLKNLHKVHQIIVGGGQVSQSLAQQLQNQPTRLFETYGMTETVSHIAVRKLNHYQGEQAYFKVLPKVTISTDSRNCLKIEAPLICEQTLQTNDIVELKTPTAFEWKGRFDYVINSGGIKLFPEQIERKIAPFLPERFLVSYQEDALLGNKLILIIETTDPHFDTEALVEVLKHQSGLSKYEIPRQVYILPNFIETPTRKVKREANRQRILEHL